MLTEPFEFGRNPVVVNAEYVGISVPKLDFGWVDELNVRPKEIHLSVRRAFGDGLKYLPRSPLQGIIE